MNLDDYIRQMREEERFLRYANIGDRALLSADQWDVIAGGLGMTASRALAETTRANELFESLTKSRLLPGLGDTGEFAQRAAVFQSSLVGPIEEYRRWAAVHESAMAQLRPAFLEYEKYAASFRMPGIDEASRLLREAVVSNAGLRSLFGSDTEFTRLRDSVLSIKAAWVSDIDPTASMRAIAGLHSLGTIINTAAPFADSTADLLRASLGDWRQAVSFPPAIFEDVVARSAFYVDRGFDLSLTAFTGEAFDEGAQHAGIDDVFASDPSDDDEDGLLRTNHAHDQLQRFERALRRFIDELMTQEFGCDWPKHQLHADILDAWRSKKERAVAEGEEPQALIAYAEFGDYIHIIVRNDNWKRVFQPVFGRRESVQESLRRLYPIRNCTMHARLVSFDDILYLRVEIKRLMRAIGLS